MFPPVRRVAVQALCSVFNESRYTDKVLEYAFKSNRKLGSRDRRQLAEAVYGCVRHWRLLCHVAGVPYAPGRTYGDEEAQSILQAYLDHASHLDQVEAHFPGLPFAIRESVSDELMQVFVDELGVDKAQSMIRAMNTTADVYLRVNTLKGTREQLLSALQQEDIPADACEGVPTAVRLRERKNVFQSQAFGQGLFEVQDLGSQKIAPLLAPTPGSRVVDACAGAGGKSLHLAALMGGKGKIVSLDIHKWKLDELKRRARRAGVSIIETRVIENNKVIKRLHENADYLLLDVPCSGSGVLKRNPDAKWKFSKDELSRLHETQRQILNEYAAMVRPGGAMVYATCSVFPSENQQQVSNFLTEQKNRWKLDGEVDVVPWQNHSDGFYAARLVRTVSN